MKPPKPLKRTTPLKRTPLKRAVPQKRELGERNPLADLQTGFGKPKKQPKLAAHSKTSVKGRQQEARPEVVKQVIARAKGQCEALKAIWQLDRQVGRSCLLIATDVHEPLTRARGGKIDDPDQCIAVCRSCHSWIHANPAKAESIGLLKPSTH